MAFFKTKTSRNVLRSGFGFGPFVFQQGKQFDVEVAVVKPQGLPQGAFVPEAQAVYNSLASGIAAGNINFYPVQFFGAEQVMDKSLRTAGHDAPALQMAAQPVAQFAALALFDELHHPDGACQLPLVINKGDELLS